MRINYDNYQKHKRSEAAVVAAQTAQTIPKSTSHHQGVNNMIKSNLVLATLGVAAALLATSNAAVLDLSQQNSGTINGALFEIGSIHPAGTGVFEPFLTLQGNGMEQGYNSSTGNFDTKREPVWNHEIRFSDLQQTTINGTAYFGFAIDINEPNAGSLSDISLIGLSLYTSSTIQNSTSTNKNGIFNGSLGTLRYDLGANEVYYIDTQKGSGESDINVYIPVSLFAGAQPNDYVYMYQRWGNADAMTQGGFEETRLIAGVTPVPELSSFFPIIGLMVAVGSTSYLRKRKLAQTVA
jgi:hypothetical protein